ncbi:DUF4234 domain-containing protein [Thermosulfurimonas sp. F29]|uniref:DUF4234 domain-containing protein n=1 Tax=Thermosulfurimonas sp. F29 TaxID=2867247 RepID=UPI001C828CE8|nr:DUF4234 domain-containing protein [Thermosulfurimonas sp. F29]MBX6423748.1 DUF4234 domain-containing protein [Thermosulfurimonas sp. F29]
MDRDLGLKAPQYRRDVAAAVVLTLLTCGIYYPFWQKHQINTVNFFLGKKKLSFWRWVLFTFLTCGLYHVYHEYLMAKYIVEIQYQIGKPVPSSHLPVLALILSLAGLPLIVDAIEQKELNEIIDHVVAHE